MKYPRRLCLNGSDYPCPRFMIANEIGVVYEAVPGRAQLRSLQVTDHAHCIRPLASHHSPLAYSCLWNWNALPLTQGHRVCSLSSWHARLVPPLTGAVQRCRGRGAFADAFPLSWFLCTHSSPTSRSPVIFLLCLLRARAFAVLFTSR